MAKNNKEIQKMVANKKQMDAQKAELDMVGHFQVDFKSFQDEMINKYGMMVGCRLYSDETSIKSILVPVKVPKKDETATK